MRRRWLNPDILGSFIRKEFRQILRDFRLRGMLFASPVIMILVFGYAVNTDVKSVRMAVLDRDRSMESRSFISKFTSSGYFIHYADALSPEHGAEMLDRGDVDIYISIPPGFSRDLKMGKTTGVQIVADGSDSIRSSVTLAYVNQVTSDFSDTYLKNKIAIAMRSRGETSNIAGGTVVLEERTLFNPELTSRNFYLPGVLGLLVSLITIMMTSMSVVKERESGTIEQIIVSPLKPMEFVAGKTLPFAIVGFIDIVVITLVTIFWFNVPFNGSFLFLLFCGLFYIICTLSLGLYISTVSQTQQQAMLSTFLFFLPSIMLSGFVFPIYAMPLFFRVLTYFNPMRYFISIIRGIFLKGVGAEVLWGDLLGLVVLSAVLLFLSVRRVSRRFE